MEKYFKIQKDIAARAGLSDHHRQEVDQDYLMLSEKDISMITLTVEEKVAALGASEVTESDIEQGAMPETGATDPESNEEDQQDPEEVEPENIEEDGNN